MKKLTSAFELILTRLWYKKNYFAGKKMLAEDGSFYYSDEYLAQETHRSEKTIMRAKRYLNESGYIKYANGRYKGTATKYWILRKPDKKSPFVDISKPDNLSVKPDNLSFKAPQNVTPNNINNKEINKDDLVTAEELKNGLKGLIISKGVDYAKKFYIERGFSEFKVQEAINGLQRDDDKC